MKLLKACLPLVAVPLWAACQSGGGGFAMLRGAPVVYDRQQEIRQLLIDEVRAKGTLRPSDYFHPNWRIVPAAAIGALLKTRE